MKDYQFDPEKFGFLPPKKMPHVLREHLHKKAYVKVIAVSEQDGSFWYKSCNRMDDDRWVFEGGLYDVRRGDHTSHKDYCGCITSEHYAKMLLIHLFGTTLNAGTLKYGKERLNAKSIPTKL